MFLILREGYVYEIVDGEIDDRFDQGLSIFQSG